MTSHLAVAATQPVGSVDWAILASWVYAVATLVLAVAAMRGVSAWRKQLHGHTDYQLARQILKTVLQLRDRLQYGVRNPWMFAAEYANRPGRDPNAVTSDVDDRAWAYQQRWNRAEETYRELEVLLFEAEAVWEGVLVDARQKLDTCRMDLMLAVRRHLDDERHPQREITDPDADRKNHEMVSWQQSRRVSK